MQTDASRRTTTSLLGLAAILTLASVGQILKFLGVAGVAAWLVLIFPLLLAGHRLALRALPLVTERQVRWLVVLTFAAIVVVFLVGYPIANSGRVGGGSDREDNLNVATSALLRGEDPYAVRGYLGYPVDVLGGSLLLAAPFVLAGNSAWQNVFWLLAFFLGAKAWLRDSRLALLLLWALLALSPALMQELVTGGDLIANSIYPILFAMLLAGLAGDAHSSPWRLAAASVLFGVGLASRANFGMIVPLTFSFLVLRAGWRKAIVAMVIAGATFGVLTIPFYLHDPAHYPPMRLQNRFGRFDSILPYAGIVVPLVTALLALTLSLRRFTRTPLDLLRNCTYVLAFPVAAGMALATMRAGLRGLMFAVQGWGLFFLFSGALYFWARLFGSGEEEHVSSPAQFTGAAREVRGSPA